MDDMDEDEKTLAEEMRDMAELWSRDGNPTVSAYTAATLARKWADELDECYVALPTDAEGRPWHIGDACVTKHGEHGNVFGIRYDDDKRCRISVLYGDMIEALLSSSLRRPQSTADRLREWVRRARADEHMDLRELDAIVAELEGEHDAD